jgi:hypothetical protein
MEECLGLSVVFLASGQCLPCPDLGTGYFCMQKGDENVAVKLEFKADIMDEQGVKRALRRIAHR